MPPSLCLFISFTHQSGVLLTFFSNSTGIGRCFRTPHYEERRQTGRQTTHSKLSEVFFLLLFSQNHTVYDMNHLYFISPKRSSLPVVTFFLEQRIKRANPCPSSTHEQEMPPQKKKVITATTTNLSSFQKLKSFGGKISIKS